MADFDAEAIKKAVVANRKRRQPYADVLRRPRLQSSAALSKQRRSVESRVTGLLADAGVGRDELRDLRSQSEIELRRLAAKQKAAVAKRSASASKSIRASLENWRQSIEHRQPATRDPLPRWVILDEPAFIWSLSGDLNVRARVSPWNNVAKVTGEWSTPPSGWGSGGDVTFLFAWSNPRDAYVLLDVDSSLGLNGLGTVAASGGFWAFDYTNMLAGVNLVPFVYRPGNYPAPPYEDTTHVEVMDVVAYGGGLFGVGELKPQAVVGTFTLTYTQFIMPPRSTAIFEVSLDLIEYIDDGWAEIDFATGDFEVVCPAVFITILS